MRRPRSLAGRVTLAAVADLEPPSRGDIVVAARSVAGRGRGAPGAADL
jgi:hypothetical protein